MHGARYEGDRSKIERDAAGKPIWAWKRDTAPLSPSQQRELIAVGKLTLDKSPFALRDPQTGESIEAHGGSVAWNAYRRRRTGNLL